jgi:hypothetical protein
MATDVFDEAAADTSAPAGDVFDAALQDMAPYGEPPALTGPAGVDPASFTPQETQEMNAVQQPQSLWETANTPLSKTFTGESLAENVEGTGEELGTALGGGDVRTLTPEERAAFDTQQSPTMRVLSGGSKGVLDLADSFATPLGIATLGQGSLPNAAQRVISGAFAGQMLSGLPGEAGQLKKDVQAGNWEQAARGAVGLVGGGIMAGMAGRHALEPGPVAPVKVKPFTSADELQPIIDKHLGTLPQAAQEVQNLTAENAKTAEPVDPNEVTHTAEYFGHEYEKRGGRWYQKGTDLAVPQGDPTNYGDIQDRQRGEFIQSIERVAKPTQEVPDASDEQKTAEVHGDVQSQSGESQREVPAEESGAGVQSQTAGGVSEAKAGEIPLTELPEPKPEHLTTTTLAGGNNPKPPLTADYYGQLGEAVNDPQTWHKWLDRILKGDIDPQESAFQLAAFIRKLGPEKAGPVIDALRQMHGEQKAANKTLFETLMKETDPAKRDALQNSPAGRKMMSSQFPREAADLAEGVGTLDAIKTAIDKIAPKIERDNTRQPPQSPPDDTLGKPAPGVDVRPPAGTGAGAAPAGGTAAAPLPEGTGGAAAGGEVQAGGLDRGAVPGRGAGPVPGTARQAELATNIGEGTGAGAGKAPVISDVEVAKRRLALHPEGRIGINSLQRLDKLPYARAKAAIDELVKEGLIEKHPDGGWRKVLAQPAAEAAAPPEPAKSVTEAAGPPGGGAKVPETPEQFPLMDVPKEAKPLIAERRQIQRILDKMDAGENTDVNDERRKPLEKRLAEIERQLMPATEKPIEQAKTTEQPALPAKDAPAPTPVNPPKTVEPVATTEKFTLENVDVPEARLALSRMESPSKKFKVQRTFLKQAVADAAQTAKPEETLSAPAKKALEERRMASEKLKTAVFKKDIEEREKDLAKADAKVRQLVPHVEIHVPGDGIFTVIKTREALKDFAERVEKRFPKSAAKPGGPGFAREGVTPTPKLGTGKPEDTHKAAASHTSTDEGRPTLQHIYGNGQELIATDGRRMIRIIEPGHGTQKNPVAMDPATGKERPWDVKKDGGQFPDYSQVIPKKRFYVGVADTEALWKAAKMAELMTDDKSIQMQLWRNQDGTFGATSKSQEGEAAHNVKDGAQLMMALQPSYLIDALESARRLGNEHVDLYMGDAGELSPITIRGKNSEDIIMPMRLADTPEPPGVGMEGYKKGWWEDIDAKMKPLFKKPLPEGVAPDKSAAEKLAKEEAAAEKAAKNKQPPGVGPAGPGLGAAIPEEFAPSSQTPTGIKNATVDRERAARGLPSAIEPARKGFGEVWDRAMARIDQDAPVPGEKLLQDRLIDELRAKPRALTDEEDALLLHRQIDLQNEYGKATRDLAQARDDGRAEDVQELGLRTAALSDRLLDLYNINKAAGTETGRGLNARKMMANEDFTLAAMELSARAAKGGRRLNEEESAEITRLHDKIAAMQKAYNDHVAATEKTIRELETRKRIKRLTDEEAARPKATKGQPTEEERQATILARLEKLVKEGKRGSDLTNIIQQLARHYVRRGVKDRDTLVDKVHAIVARLVPEMERRDTMDAISGYGDFKQLSKDQVSTELRDLKGQMQQVAKLEDMQRGQPPEKTGVERRTPSAEERRLIKLVNEAKRKFQIPVTDPATQLKSSLDTLKTRMRNRTKELQDKLDAGDFSQKQPPKPIQMDAEALRLKAQLERTKTEYLTGLEKDRLKQRTPLEKFQDTLVKWRRGYLLSGFSTLAKLVSAAAERMAFSPLEEAAGSVLGKAFPRFAERTSRKVGLSVSAEAKAIADGFTKGMNDAAQTLKTGHSDLDVLYGKRDVMPREAIDFFGQIHGALKAPTKRNEFARSFELRVQQALDKGIDASDPMVQTGLAMEAYKDANRSIFLQDNRVVSAYKRALSKFDEVDKETGKVPFTSKAAGTAARVALPIVKIPTNLVAETMDYALGTVTGGAKLANAYRKGIETLPPGQADMIARQLKKGSLGAAVLLLGFLNPQNIGGYYQQGDKRNPKDVKVGSVRVFGVNIPSYLVHNPLLETLQLGSTIRRVAQSKLKKSDTETRGLGWGLWAGALGLADETPFLREAGEFLKLANKQEQGAAAGELAKSLIVPQVLSDIARVTDRDAKGNIIERKPATIAQHVKTGIPGLRETVKRKPK